MITFSHKTMELPVRPRIVSFPTAHSPNRKKQLAAISFSMSPPWTKRLPLRENAQVCRMAFAWKSGLWRANVLLPRTSGRKHSLHKSKSTRPGNIHGSLC